MLIYESLLKVTMLFVNLVKFSGFYNHKHITKEAIGSQGCGKHPSFSKYKPDLVEFGQKSVKA